MAQPPNKNDTLLRMRQKYNSWSGQLSILPALNDTELGAKGAVKDPSVPVSLPVINPRGEPLIEPLVEVDSTGSNDGDAPSVLPASDGEDSGGDSGYSSYTDPEGHLDENGAVRRKKKIALVLPKYARRKPPSSIHDRLHNQDKKRAGAQERIDPATGYVVTYRDPKAPKPTPPAARKDKNISPSAAAITSRLSGSERPASKTPPSESSGRSSGISRAERVRKSRSMDLTHNSALQYLPPPVIHSPRNALTSTPRASKSVERLTDPTLFTGSHKYRATFVEGSKLDYPSMNRAKQSPPISPRNRGAGASHPRELPASLTSMNSTDEDDDPIKKYMSESALDDIVAAPPPPRVQPPLLMQKMDRIVSSVQGIDRTTTTTSSPGR